MPWCSSPFRLFPQLQNGFFYKFINRLSFPPSIFIQVCLQPTHTFNIWIANVFLDYFFILSWLTNSCEESSLDMYRHTAHFRLRHVIFHQKIRLAAHIIAFLTHTSLLQGRDNNKRSLPSTGSFSRNKKKKGLICATEAEDHTDTCFLCRLTSETIRRRGVIQVIRGVFNKAMIS